MYETQMLAAFVAHTRPQDLPPPLIDRMKAYLLDALAGAVTGRGQPWTTSLRAVVESRGGSEECTAVGTPFLVPAPSAAWLNGLAIGGCELDHGAHQAHPASTVLPAAIAAAELTGAPGAELLCAMAVGYEVACRIGAAGTRAVEDERHLHNPGTNGPFGAAASAAKLLGLSERRILNALGIAGSSAAGLTEYLSDGSMTKRLHLAAAARGGYEAAELADQGLTGPATVIEGPRGFLAAFSPSPRPDRLLEGLGETWLCDSLAIKAYPCHGTLQDLVGTLSRARASLPRGSQEIYGVHLELGPGQRLLQGRFQERRPATLIAAQMSMPACVAVALCRNLADPTTFTEDVLADPEVRRLSDTVSWSASPSPGVAISVESSAGTMSLTVSHPGWPDGAKAELPAVTEKFERHTAAALTSTAQQALVRMVSTADTLPDGGVILRTLNAALLSAG